MLFRSVHAADKSNNWAVSNALENQTDNQSFIPNDIFKVAVKLAAQESALMNMGKRTYSQSDNGGRDRSSRDSSTRGPRGKQRTKDRGGRDHGGGNNNRRDEAASGSSHKKDSQSNRGASSKKDGSAK